MKIAIAYTFSVVALIATSAGAQERASLNAQEYECRSYIQECLLGNPNARKRCFSAAAIPASCSSSPLRRYIAQRDALESELTDTECLRRIDAELSGLLAKDLYSLTELQSLEEKLPQCKQQTAEELFR